MCRQGSQATSAIEAGRGLGRCNRTVLQLHMAATARLLEPLERLVELAPLPAAQFTLPTNSRSSPKVLAEKIVHDAERDSRAWIGKFATAVDSFREQNLPHSFWEAVGNFISAHIDLMKVQIDQNRAQSEETLAQVSPSVPLTALRIITRGLDRVYTQQHAQLVDIYYRAMSEVWDRDEDARGGTEAAFSADDVAAFFKQVRGS